MAKYSVSYIYQIVDKYTATANRIKRSTDRMKDSVKRATVSFNKMGKSMQRAGAWMTAFVSLPIALLGRGMLKAASDAEETRSKFNTIFREMGDGAQGVADDFARSFGLAGTTSRKLLGDTADMLTGFGFTADAALNLSKRTNELAVDLASFTNFAGGAEGASAALTKALLGERESIKSLGIAILEEDVKRKIQQMRSEGIRFATNREAKAYATLQIAIEQSKNAIGDYERTKSSFANTQRRVAQNNIELMESFGKLLIPVATKALLAFERLQNSLIAMDGPSKNFLLITLGIAAALAPIVLLLGTIAVLMPVIAAGFAVLASPITLIAAGIAGFVLGFRHLYKNSETFRRSLMAIGKASGIVLLPLKMALKGIIDLFSLISGSTYRLFQMFGGGGGGLNVNMNNPAAQGAANNNTLNGSIDITAQGATVNNAQFGSNAPGNIGTTVAAQGG